MTLNIKGVKYTISFKDKPFAEGGFSCVLDGCCDYDQKEIKIRKIEDKARLLNVISHELFHAYLYECGLDDYASNETLITWLGNHFAAISTGALEIFNKTKEEIKKDGKRRINTKK